MFTLLAGTAPQAPSFVNNGAILGLILFVAGLIGGVVGLGVMMSSRKGDVRGAANSGLVFLIGGAILALAIGGAWFGVASGALDTLINA